MTLRPAVVRSLFFRVLCKAWELACRGLTGILRLGKDDPTLILLDYMTPAQLAAAKRRREEILRKVAGAARVRVLVIIPFRDRWSLTRLCLDSLLMQDLGALDLRIVLLDNGSREAATKDGIEAALEEGERRSVRTQRIDEPFNFSRINNAAVAAHADFEAEVVLFLNNDIEFKRDDDLARLALFTRDTEKAGAVGCSLFYPSGEAQHLFLAPGVKIVAAHPLKGARLSPDSAWFEEPRPVGAVTGAVLLVRADAFRASGGFDERLPTVGQDVDLCLRLQRLGLTNWVLPSVQAVHHEGATRGRSIDKAEVAIVYETWGETLTRNAYYSTKLSRYSEAPVLAPLTEPSYPWRLTLP